MSHIPPRSGAVAPHHRPLHGGLRARLGHAQSRAQTEDTPLSQFLKSLPYRVGPGIRKLIARSQHGKKPEPAVRRLGYVILVSDEVHNYMRKLAVAILHACGANSGLKPSQHLPSPHITLKQAFAVQTLEPFEQYFDRLASEVEPFEIVMRGVGVFDQGIIFLDVVEDRRLTTLRLRILRDLAEQFGVKPQPLEDERYHFHATLAYGLSEADFAQARQVLQNIKVEFRFMFNTLGMFYHTGDEWITYKRSRVAGSIT